MEKIVSLNDKFNGNKFVDTLGNDKNAPCFPIIAIDKNFKMMKLKFICLLMILVLNIYIILRLITVLI